MNSQREQTRWVFNRRSSPFGGQAPAQMERPRRLWSRPSTVSGSSFSLRIGHHFRRSVKNSEGLSHKLAKATRAWFKDAHIYRNKAILGGAHGREHLERSCLDFFNEEKWIIHTAVTWAVQWRSTGRWTNRFALGMLVDPENTLGCKHLFGDHVKGIAWGPGVLAMVFTSGLDHRKSWIVHERMEAHNFCQKVF